MGWWEGLGLAGSQGHPPHLGVAGSIGELLLVVRHWEGGLHRWCVWGRLRGLRGGMLEQPIISYGKGQKKDKTYPYFCMRLYNAIPLSGGPLGGCGLCSSYGKSCMSGGGALGYIGGPLGSNA